ncbi:unnamed protein product [Heterobilharzia americana]|nr:unnamed protein product [Heterobilharzia americana]CAH8452352.1 unnamed protein product [Heterobilharzia americana]
MAADSLEGSSDCSHPISVANFDPVDITEAFFSACRIGLEPGELFHEGWFDLQYSMSAIEIMDPKMDARIQGNRRVMTTFEALSTNQLPLGPFSSLYELIGVMDELLSACVNWLTGDSLAQSIFICMYMHCTQLINDKYLAAFCELLRRMVYQLRHLIIAVGVFDEEDHYTFTHGMPIQEPSSIFHNYNGFRNNCLHKLSTLDLIAHASDLNGSLESDPTTFIDHEEKLLSALRSRLEFMQAFLLFTNSVFERISSTSTDLKNDLFEGYTNIDFDYGEQNLSLPKICEVQASTLVSWNSFICFCRRVSQHVNRLKLLSNVLIKTSSVGKVASEGKLQPKDATYGLPGFEVFLNQANIPSYMPRVVNIHDRHKSFVYFSHLFTKLEHILRTYETFTEWHRLYPEPLRLQSLWAFIQKSGQISCSYVRALLSNANCGKDKESSLTTCILARTMMCMLYFVLMCHGDIIDFKPQSFSPMNFHYFLNSWYQVEHISYRSLIKDIISEIPELMNFFTTLSNQFAHIPAVYCLNRSRQRSALERWLQRLPDLLDECARAEFVIGIELRNATTDKHFEYQRGLVDLSPKQSVVPVQIQLSSFVTYIYYYLAWDYVISGFQLELYSPNEWLFIYAFLIHLFQNLSNLIRHLSEKHIVLSLEKIKNLESESTKNKTSMKQTVTCDSGSGVEIHRRKKKKKHKEKVSVTDETIRCTETSHTNCDSGIKPMPPMIHEIGSVFETNILGIHQYLNSASLYAIRALQRDVGFEINENIPNLNSTNNTLPCTFMNRTSRLESYARRLGIFLIPPNSPLFELGGVSGAYDSWKSLIGSSLIDGRSTSELYCMASRAFDQAQSLIQTTLDLRPSGEENLRKLMQSDIAVSLFTETLGPPDRLVDLQQLAKHNSIACRVLGVCEDRRPSVHKSKHKISFLCSSSPVKLDYNFLESKCYPLIRLASQSEKCS